MKTKTAVLNGKPDAGNPHVRFDEGEVASAKPRRGSLLYKRMVIGLVVVLLGGMAAWADSTWKGQNGKWSVEDNWEGGVPTAADIAVFPKNTAGYTVEVDQDVECKFIRGDSNLDGKGTKITFTGSGKLTASGYVAGPSNNSFAKSGYEMIFTNITATIAAFNPYDGTLTIEDGADVTIGTAFYINGQASKVVVNGGLLTVPGADIRTKCSVTVNGGTLNMQSKTANVRTDGVVFTVNGGLLTGARFNFAYSNVDKADTVRLTGGTLALGGAAPLNFDKCTIDIAGGTLVWYSESSFDADTHAAWAPKAGAKLVLPCNSYTALTVQPGDTLDVDGDIYATNNLAYVKEHPTDTKAPGFYLNTNSVVRGEGSLYANYLFVRSTTTVEVASMNLGHRVHFAKSDSVLRVPNGITFGAYADWTSVYNNALSYFFGPITVDTSDCFDHETPRKITLGRAVLDGGVDYHVTGCGTNVLKTGEANSNVRSVAVDAGATFLFDGYYGNDRQSSLKTDALVLGADSTLALRARRSSIVARKVTADPSAKVEIDVTETPVSAQAMPVLVDSALADFSSSVTLTGAHAGEVTAKSVGGVLYLTDGTTPELKGDLPAHTWTGAAGGNWSEPSNWYSNAVPVNSTTTANAAWPHFCGTKNTVVTNDLTGSDASYRGGAGVFGLHFDDTCAPYEIHGNSIRLSPQGYSGENAAFYSKSKNPVVVYAPLWRASKFGIIVGSSSYAQFMGPVEASGSNGDFYLRGDVRFGGQATCGGFVFWEPVDTIAPDKLTILGGGSLYVANNTIVNTLGEKNKAVSAEINVDEGGSFVVAAPVLQPGKTAYTCRIDGYFAASNGVRFLKSSSFNGTGTVYFGGVSNTNVTRALSFGGGITLAMGGDWNVVTAENPATPVTLKATGDMKLVAAADWTYGPETGVETAADWAMAVAADATLTIGKSDFAMRIAEPIVVEGEVAFEADAKLVPTGALAASAEVGWTPVVTAKAVTGEPTDSDRYRVRTVENDDGTVTLEAKARTGMVIFVK